MKLKQNIKQKGVIILLLFICFNARAQFSAVGSESKIFKAFEACSSIEVVLSGDKTFDDAIKSAIELNWNLKPAQYINKATFNKSLSDESKAFMLLCTILNDKGQEYHFLTILMGGGKRLSDYSYNDMVAYCPLNGLANESPLTKCAFRLPVLIHQLQSTINLVKTNDLGKNGFSIGVNLSKLYREKAKEIEKKTLLINTDACDVKFTEEEIKKVYQFPIEFCNNEKVAEVIKKKDAKYAILQPAITLNKFTMVFDAATYECLYSSTALMGMKLKSGDIKDISEAINKIK